MNRKLQEVEVLRELGIPSFQDMTKNEIMKFTSMVDTMDPEVARRATEQVPNFFSMSLDVFKDYRTMFEKAFDSNKDNSERCFEVYNRLIMNLEKYANSEIITFEERKYYIELMIEIAREMRELKSEDKKHNNEILNLFVSGVVALLGIGALFFGVQDKINGGGGMNDF